MLLIPGLNLAQSPEITRLRGLVLNGGANSEPPADTNVINNLNLLTHAFYSIDADSAFFYGKKALEFSKKVTMPAGSPKVSGWIGNEYKFIGDYPNMLSCYFQALTIAEKISNPTLVAKTNMNIAIFYDEVGKYDEALAVLQQPPGSFEEIGDSLQLIYVLSNISDTWYRQQQYGKALEYDLHALKIAKALKNDYPVAFLNNDVGKDAG